MAGETIRTKNFVADAASFIVDLARSSIQERGAFSIALSGGNTPRPVYAEMARQLSDVDWNKALITFSDERCVPPDSDQSNYRMAKETLLAAASIPEGSVMRMRGEIDPKQAADEYEKALNELGSKQGQAIFRHDLILLGMGDDGHTASLFPGTAALEEQERNVVANFVPKVDMWRLTFTYRLINAARNVCFLVNAKKNRELIDQVIAGDDQYPAARVKPIDGKLTWILGE